MAQCTAHSSRTGLPCKGQAITGATVCTAHGGNAPQVREAARRRLALALDPTAKRLVELINNRKLEARDTLAAIRELFDRAGMSSTEGGRALNGENGQVLWEEFVSIHRRRFGRADETTDDERPQLLTGETE